jgi:uncharacterized protein (TIGR03435 family)
VRNALLAAVCFGFLNTAAVFAQEFEVAAVKQSPPPEGDTININLGTVRNGRLTFANASLSDCLKFAYNIASDAQLAGPDWIKDARFDIVAQAPAATPREQLALMLQTLLAERLKVVLHHEQKTLPFLALVVGKNGPKFHEAKADPAPDTGFNVAGRIVRNQLSMRMLALLLSRFERQTVLDMTGLKGLFEVRLEWTPDDGRAPAAADSVGPSLYTAVQGQLGLKLEARKGPVDVLVVDSAEKVPADN